MHKTLILAGGGHAHMMLLANLRAMVCDGIRVIVIQPAEHHYYSGMGPGLLGGTYTPEQIRFATRHVVETQGGTFLRDRVVNIRPQSREVVTASGAVLSYDVLSCNTGSAVPRNTISGRTDTVFTVKPIERLQEARRRIRELGAARTRPEFAIIGGGPAALEVAGNVWKTARLYGRPRITLFAGRGLLRALPPALRRLALASLHERGINVDETGHVRGVHDGVITTASDARVHPDLTLVATGVRPSPIFTDSGLPTGPDGGLLVNRYLQCPQWPDIFGGGDCIHFAPQPLDKVGVYAVRQNPVLLANVRARLRGASLTPFQPGGGYLLLFNLGDGTAIFRKGPVLFRSKLAMTLKDRIDRRFMIRFQSLEG